MQSRRLWRTWSECWLLPAREPSTQHDEEGEIEMKIDPIQRTVECWLLPTDEEEGKGRLLYLSGAHLLCEGLDLVQCINTQHDEEGKYRQTHTHVAYETTLVICF